MRASLIPVWGPWEKDEELALGNLKLGWGWYIKSKQVRSHIKAIFRHRYYCPHMDHWVKTVWPNGTTVANEYDRKPLRQFCMGCFRIRRNMMRLR